jgi:hypothetical protein
VPGRVGQAGSQSRRARASGSGLAVRRAGLVIAVVVEVLDAVPARVDVDVGDDLAPFQPGYELELLPTMLANGVVAGLDEPYDGTANGEDGGNGSHPCYIGPPERQHEPASPDVKRSTVGDGPSRAFTS